MRTAEGAAANQAAILGWRQQCLLYALLVAFSLGYIAEPGDPVWLAGAELPWIALDLFLVAALLRRSGNALIVCGALDMSALVCLVVAEAAQSQAGFSMMVGLLVARLVVLLRLWKTFQRQSR
jgi:hypothetical protein